MAGPWEDYAAATPGPWADYTPEPVAAGPSPAMGARGASELQGHLSFDNDGSGGVPASLSDIAGNQGSSTGFGAKAANSLLFNYGDELAGAAGAVPALFTDEDYKERRERIRDRARGFLKDYEAQDPHGATVADVTGKGIGAMMLPNAVVGRVLGAAPGIGRSIAGGALLAAPGAALSRTGEMEGPATVGDYASEGGEAALYGGGIGGALGGAGRIIGGVVGPWATEAAQRLTGRGVRLTPGEVLGGFGKRAEDIVTSLPGVGQMVRNRQREGIESVNRAAWDEALEPIRTQGQGARFGAGVEMGHDAQQEAQQIFNRRYGRVVPRMRAEFDVPLENEIRAISAAIPQTIRPQYGDAFRRHIRENMDMTTPQGHITGRALQDSLQGLRDEAMNLRRNPGHAYDIDLANALDDTRAALETAAARYTPTRTMNMFRNINTAYQRFATLRRAGAGVGTVDSVFTPAQLKNAVVASDRSVGKGASARGTMPLQQLAQDAKNTMARQVADSGTPERGALMTLMAGGVGGHMLGIPPAALGVGAGLAGLYTRTGNRMFQSLATFSPATRRILRRAIEQAATRSGVPAAEMYGDQ